MRVIPQSAYLRHLNVPNPEKREMGLERHYLWKPANSAPMVVIDMLLSGMARSRAALLKQLGSAIRGIDSLLTIPQPLAVEDKRIYLPAFEATSIKAQMLRNKEELPLIAESVNDEIKAQYRHMLQNLRRAFDSTQSVDGLRYDYIPAKWPWELPKIRVHWTYELNGKYEISTFVLSADTIYVAYDKERGTYEFFYFGVSGGKD
jgi:hypothetical protein